ncbi:MAG: hypothetical protein AAFX85_19255 [Pseudomonadota bacterium]
MAASTETSPLRVVLAGVEDSVLADIVEDLIEHGRLPLEVVARTGDRDHLADLAKRHHADLVLLCDAMDTVRPHSRLRDAMADTALVLLERNGRAVSTCVDAPGIEDLIAVIEVACRRQGKWQGSAQP